MHSVTFELKQSQRCECRSRGGVRCSRLTVCGHLGPWYVASCRLDSVFAHCQDEQGASM